MKFDRKIFLVFGMILLLMAVGYQYSPDMFSLFPLGDELRVKQKQLNTYRAAIAERDTLQKELVAVNSALARSERRLLSGSTPALAGVDLQNLLNDIAARSQVEIARMRILNPVEAAPGYLSIPVQVDFNAELRQILNIIHRLESAPKMIRISNARFRTSSGSNWRFVRVTLVAEGFMAGEVE